MSLTSLRLHTSRTTTLVIIIGLLIPYWLVRQASAGEIPNTSSQCADIVLLFARGSGQNNSHQRIDDPLNPAFSAIEKESYAFFKNHKDHFSNYYPTLDYKAVSIHDFPGKYDPVGYLAAPVGFGPGMRIPNSANADASWVPGDYQASVKHGIVETVGYLKDQIANCPGQYFIVGGYSQGAQVIGESLFQLTKEEQAKILGVGFFGDPNYIGSSDALKGDKPEHTTSYPWRRGEASNKDAGMLEPRYPYVPQGLERRTISWCSRYDIVCAGWSAYRPYSSHSEYANNPIRYAVDELVNIAAPQLLALQRGEGNVPVTQISLEDRDRNRDVMFLFSDNSNEDVLRTFRYSLDPMMHQLVGNFTGTRFAAKSFAEHDYGFSAPRVNNVQSFLPYQGYDPSNPVFTSSNLTKAFASKYPFGRPVIGGGDIADPYQLGIERAVTSAGWRDDPRVERNIILITDRPPKDPYEYNICNSTVRQWMHFPETDGYKNCYTDFRREVWQKVLVPETCETVLMVITEDTCMNPQKTPHYIQMNKRTLEDSVKIAQAYNTKISIVIPRKITDSNYNSLGKETMRNNLKSLAYRTGGTFIYYGDQTHYNSTLLYDTLYQVFTKKQKSLHVTVNGDGSPRVLGLRTSMPAVLDVSRQGVVADSYRWDFNDDGTWDETSQGPVIEHIFTTATKRLLRVQALGVDGTVLGETRQAYTVTADIEEEQQPPVTPTDITAQELADNRVLITWEPQNEGELIVFDPATNLPVGSALLSAGTLVLPSFYESLKIRIVVISGSSDPVTIDVSGYVIPLPEIDAPETGSGNPPNPYVDETLCYKLQQCNQESLPVITVSEPVLQAPGSSQSITTVIAPSSTEDDTTNLWVSDTPEVAGVSVGGSQTPAIATSTPVPTTVKNSSDAKLLIILIVSLLGIAFAVKFVRRKDISKS